MGYTYVMPRPYMPEATTPFPLAIDPAAAEQFKYLNSLVAQVAQQNESTNTYDPEGFANIQLQERAADYAGVAVIRTSLLAELKHLNEQPPDAHDTETRKVIEANLSHLDELLQYCEPWPWSIAPSYWPLRPAEPFEIFRRRTGRGITRRMEDYLARTAGSVIVLKELGAYVYSDCSTQPDPAELQEIMSNRLYAALGQEGELRGVLLDKGYQLQRGIVVKDRNGALDPALPLRVCRIVRQNGASPSNKEEDMGDGRVIRWLAPLPKLKDLVVY